MASDWRQISQPPPSARPAGAVTTGKGAYFSALKVHWPVSISRSTSPQAAMLAANKARPRLAPAEKFCASV